MIWIISEVYYPEETATGHFMTGIAEGLATRDAVTVICSQPKYSKRSNLLPWRETHNRVDIERCWSTRFDKNRYLGKLVNVLTTSVAMFWLCLRRIRKGDRVLVVTNPPLAPFFVLLACRVRGGHCTLRVDDVYPDAMVSANIIRPTGLVFRVIDRCNRSLYSGMENIVVLGRDMATLVNRKAGRSNDRTAYIPNWADIDAICPKARKDSRLVDELALHGKFVVGYAGNIGPLQGIRNLFECALRLKGNRNIHFLFVGSGRELAWLTNSAREANVENLSTVGERPREEQTAFLSAFDVAIVSLVRGMLGVGVPSRSYNFMAAGKAIIAVLEPDSEIALMIREERIGWVVPPDQPEMLVAAILEALGNLAALAEMGQRARRAAEQKYHREVVVEQYRRLLAS